jgi:DNA-binding NarL/FixJ family response regulator
MKPKNCLDVLYIENNILDYKLIYNRLQNDENNFLKLDHSQTLREAEIRLKHQSYQLVLLDLSLPDVSDLEGLYFLKNNFPHLPLIVLTKSTNKSMGIRAIQEGAKDYLLKGEFNNELLLKTCHYSIERTKIQQKLTNVLEKVEFLNAELQKAFDELNAEKKLVEKQHEQIHSFINILVHDLKNPTATISSITNLLLEDKSKISLNQRKYLEQIGYSASLILDNIMTIVDTTQVNKASLQLSLIADNPYFTLTSSLDKFIIEAIQKNIIFEIKWNKDFPKVYFDRRSLENVMSQILSFVVEKTPSDTRIVFLSENFQNFVKIKIDIKGVILSEDELLSFYSDYKNNYTEESYNVALAKKLIEAMGGEFIAKPKEGQKGLWIEFSLSKGF